MKKIIVLLMVLILTWGTMGCSKNGQNPNGDNTLNNDVEQQTQTREGLENSELPPIVGSQIEYLFNSAKDLDTYITTGSKNIEDYTAAPQVSFDLLPEPKVIKAYGYHSIFEYFTFDESAFDYVEASFMFTDDDSSIFYRYYIDNYLIIIQPAEAENLLDCYQSTKNVVLDDSDVVTYSKDIPKDGLVLRKAENCEVLYEMQNGVKKVANFIIDDSYVRIVSTYFSNESTRLNDYNAFLTDPDAAAFSAFFSENDQVFDKATSNIAK